MSQTNVQQDPLPISVGAQASMLRTITEFDIQHFARLTGDFSAVHVDDDLMSKSAFGSIIAHGAYIVGLMSAASTRFIESLDRRVSGETAVSLGYDRVRFVSPVYANQTIRIDYCVINVDQTARRLVADVCATEQDSGAVVAVATNVLKWVKDPVVENS